MCFVRTVLVGPGAFASGTLSEESAEHGSRTALSAIPTRFLDSSRLNEIVFCLQHVAILVCSRCQLPYCTQKERKESRKRLVEEDVTRLRLRCAYLAISCLLVCWCVMQKAAACSRLPACGVSGVQQWLREDAREMGREHALSSYANKTRATFFLASLSTF